MKPSFQTDAAIRFGYGLSPVVAAPPSVEAMLARLQGPDDMARRYPIIPFAQRAEEERVLGVLRKAMRAQEDGAKEVFKKANAAARADLMREMRVSMLRPMLSEDGFRERLVRFWADHFTVIARSKGLAFVTTGYIESAIRPHITGNFATLLRAAAIHPAMLIYLDQIASIGPNSVIGKRKNRGLNENLAREVLELHTLGVGGTYSQTDVREFAELLTGLFYNFRTGVKFREASAEPGAEQVLGQSYGGKNARLDDIHAILDDLARHPDTARHIARKLVVHFVSDAPDERLVDHVATAYRDSGGELLATYAALLEHPVAWENPGQKAKQPFDFIVSTMRALNVSPDQIENLKLRKTRLYLHAPLQVMGQPWLQPAGPDGWPEALEDWITPQGLAARIQWALVVAGLYGKGLDPKEFARATLADRADARLVRAVGFAESRLEGIALVLASPEFNRR